MQVWGVDMEGVMQVWGRTYCKGGMFSRASVQMCGNVLYIKIENFFF